MKCCPENAEFKLNPDNNCDFSLLICWKLNNDPHRPNKRSKTLKIIIPQENIEDYQEMNTNHKEICDQKFQESIKKIMVDFEPNHSNSYGKPNPIVTYNVSLWL